MENEPKELTLIDLAVVQNIKPKPLALAEKSFPYVVSDEKYSLGGYSEHQRENWAGSKITIYENDAQLRKFIKQAKDGKIVDEKMYFGRISSGLAERIKSETATDIDLEGYNLAISSNEIRKIFNSHGDKSTEEPRGQRAIIEDDIVNIPLVIQNLDKIMLGEEFYEGKPVFVFIKTINGRTTIVSYVSHRKRDLRVQTMYSGKKKLTPDTATIAQSPISTSETNNGTSTAIDAQANVQ
ncbi:MAG: hypothetical protein LBQ87_06795 [Candidatus Fibromonas sp.]|jgi:hypothetical protein|nr:hypothetical protein [Candidatus Fibromonas sp.]